MDKLEIFSRLVLSLGLGLMIGVERGWKMRGMEEGTRAFGARTFSLIGLLGGLIGLTATLSHDAVIPVGIGVFVSFVAVAYFASVRQIQDRGATTEVAAILAMILGVVAMRGDMLVAAAAAVMVTAILGFKQPIHSWIDSIDKDEIGAVLKLLVISVVILPVLPNEGFGPGEIINPYVLWWIVVVIAAISFAAHISMRLFDDRVGAIGVGLLGGLVSSTATTIAFAKLAAAHPPLARQAAASIAIAGGVMFIRTLVLTSVLYNAAVELLWFPLITAGATTIAVALFLSFGAKKSKADHDPGVGASADIMTGIKFVLAFIVIALLTHYAQEHFGSQGALIASALGGFVDVDATTATMARLGASGSAATVQVATAILVAAGVNTFAKGLYATVIAGGKFGRLSLMIFGAPLATGGLAYAAERLI